MTNLHYLPEIFFKLYTQTVFNYLYLFLIGAFLAEHKSKILPIVIRYWYVLTVVAIILYITEFDIPMTNYSVLKCIFCVYGLIGFAYSFPQLNIKVDMSYGLYIYHMTVVNVMITLGLTGRLIYMLLALGTSMILALISTILSSLLILKRRTQLLNL